MNYKLIHREPGYNGKPLTIHEIYRNEKTLNTVDKLWNGKGKLKFILHSNKSHGNLEGENLELMYKTKK